MQAKDTITKTIGMTLLATTIVVSTLAVLVLAVEFVLLIFLAILFGVFLTKTSQLMGKLIPLAYGWNLGILTGVLLLTLIACLIGFGFSIEQQLDQTSAKLDRSAEKVNRWMQERPLMRKAFSKVPFANELLNSNDSTESQSENSSSEDNQLDQEIAQAEGDNKKPDTDENRKKTQSKELGTGESDNDESSRDNSSNTQGDVSSAESPSAGSASRSSEREKGSSSSGDQGSSQVVQSAAGKVFGVLGRLLSTTLGAVANVGIVFFIALFIAANPTLYRDGVVWLFPQDRRERVTEVMNKIGDTLFRWLNGRFLAMLITGTGTWLALMLLGVPMSFTIGVITGLLTFIPNIGAVIALLLAMLMALTQGPMTVLWVIVLYAGLQLVESNIITPLVQQHQTSIPPALLIAFQIVMGALTGFLGVMVATPLLAMGMVLVKEVWIKDTLDDDSFEAEASEAA